MADDKDTEQNDLPHSFTAADLQLPRYTPGGINLTGGRWYVHLQLNASKPIGNGQIADFAVASVDLPWTLAKATHEVLGLAIADYERANGEIVLPKDYTVAREERQRTK